MPGDASDTIPSFPAKLAKLEALITADRVCFVYSTQTMQLESLKNNKTVTDSNNENEDRRMQGHGMMLYATLSIE